LRSFVFSSRFSSVFESFFDFIAKVDAPFVVSGRAHHEDSDSRLPYCKPQQNQFYGLLWFFRSFPGQRTHQTCITCFGIKTIPIMIFALRTRRSPVMGRMLRFSLWNEVTSDVVRGLRRRSHGVNSLEKGNQPAHSLPGRCFMLVGRQFGDSS
jgi:hypothetical protein